MRILVSVLAALTLLAGGAQAADNGKKKHGKIEGRLVDYAGVPLTGVIALCAPDGRKIRYYSSWALDKGKFFMNDLTPGTYLLHVDSVGPNVEGLRPPADRAVVVAAGKTVKPLLVAEPGDPAGPKVD